MLEHMQYLPRGYMKMLHIFSNHNEDNFIRYRTRAISGRSRLVAAPLRNHAKSQFLCDNLRVQKIIFEYKARPLMARVR